MSALELYRDFRKKFPERTRAADARHIRIWDRVDEESASSWFESLAGAVNEQMEIEQQRPDLALVFQYFEGKLRGNDDEAIDCIDVSFVENLFWEVKSKTAACVWTTMPRSMQRLYLNFHGHPPTPD